MGLIFAFNLPQFKISFSRLAAILVLLDRGAFYGAIAAENAAIPRLGL